MNTVVNKLLDVDRRARQLLDDAKQYYDKTIEELDKEKEQIREKYAEKAAQHVADVRQTESAHVEDSVNRLGADTAEKISRLEQVYEESHQKWEDELFRRCVEKASGQVSGGA
ncbi:hypothetical protein LJC63_07205 [Ruminococcaceae bacterium OttesenSCG-928-L11]|nr:hypothetical protein [Ruminococcaceae bacterium OttesenSCG-928-L11]